MPISAALPALLIFLKTSVHNDYLYSRDIESIQNEIDRIAVLVAHRLETAFGCLAAPVPCDEPSEFADVTENRVHGTISIKHAAEIAGLGWMGKNTLLLNPVFGNRLMLGAVLTDLDLPSDPPAPRLCLEICYLCIDRCPSHALTTEASFVQKRCRANTYIQNSRGQTITHCWTCRRVCPMGKGKGK